jgi:hypothetical protein
MRKIVARIMKGDSFGSNPIIEGTTKDRVWNTIKIMREK